MLSPTTTQTLSLKRLRAMRTTMKEELEGGKPQDNCLRSAIQGVVCLRRIKHAGLIGRFYWKKDRNTQDLSAADSDWSAGLMNYEGHKEQPYMQLMKQNDPNDFGGLDFAQLGMAMGMEIDCFSSFLAGSVKDDVTDSYQLKQAFVEIPAPPRATSITLTSLKTIAQTIISMPVMVTPHQDESEEEEVRMVKKRVRKVKQSTASQEAATTAPVDATSEVDIAAKAPAKSKKRTKKAAVADTASKEAVETSAKKKSRSKAKK